MIKEYPASTFEYWHSQWVNKNVASVDATSDKVIVKHHNMITHHTQLLNALIEKYNLKSYLEIGVQNPANNFDKINIDGNYKEGVDPECECYTTIYQMTSDKYFSMYNGGRKFDLIFIDGLHHADQVKRDFENSLRCLSDNGFIVIHDVLPENEEGTIVPRITKRWWGDVYKWAMRIGDYGIEYKTFNIDNGCMVVCKKPKVWDLKKMYAPGSWSNDWDLYKLHGHTLMNVTSAVEI